MIIHMTHLSKAFSSSVVIIPRYVASGNITGSAVIIVLSGEVDNPMHSV